MLIKSTIPVIIDKCGYRVGALMEMKKINAGKLRAIGYDRRERVLRVEFDDGMEPGLIGLAAMEAEISGLFGGRKVDLRTPRELSRYFRDEVMRNAQVQYVA